MLLNCLHRSSSASSTQQGNTSILLTTANRAFDAGLIKNWEDFLPPPGLQPSDKLIINVVLYRLREGLSKETILASIRTWS